VDVQRELGLEELLIPILEAQTGYHITVT
jgi:hypothetical protein